jgi:heptosyltransferase I
MLKGVMNRVLISRLSALGDTVCTLPVAVALKRSFPECHITWLVDPRFAGVVECCTAVDEVLTFKPGLRSLPRFSSPFDVALDMQGLLKSAIPVALSRAKLKLAYHWQREGSGLFAQRVLPDPSSFHIVDQYVDVAREFGCSMDKAEFDLVPGQEEILSVRAKLKGKGVSGRFVVLNAGAGWATKRWPPESFARVAEAIADAGLNAVLVGGNGPADREAAQEVCAASRQPPASMLGETSVRELIALIRLASAHIGGDTGSTHIAAALDVPAIGLYAITRLERSCPYGQRDRCLYDPGGLKLIPAADVMAKLFEALDPPGHTLGS